MMLFKKLSISILLAMMSSILIQTDALGDETVTQEARPKGRSLYMGIFGGGGSPVGRAHDFRVRRSDAAPGNVGQKSVARPTPKK